MYNDDRGYILMSSEDSVVYFDTMYLTHYQELSNTTKVVFDRKTMMFHPVKHRRGRNLFFRKSQVVENCPIDDFVSWVEVVFVVFVLP